EMPLIAHFAQSWRFCAYLNAFTTSRPFPTNGVEFGDCACRDGSANSPTWQGLFFVMTFPVIRPILLVLDAALLEQRSPHRESIISAEERARSRSSLEAGAGAWEEAGTCLGQPAKGDAMKRFASLLCAVLAIFTAAEVARADAASLHYGGYQPWWNIFAKRNRYMSAEEERLQRFW